LFYFSFISVLFQLCGHYKGGDIARIVGVGRARGGYVCNEKRVRVLSRSTWGGLDAPTLGRTMQQRRPNEKINGGVSERRNGRTLSHRNGLQDDCDRRPVNVCRRRPAWLTDIILRKFKAVQPTVTRQLFVFLQLWFVGYLKRATLPLNVTRRHCLFSGNVWRPISSVIFPRISCSVCAV